MPPETESRVEHARSASPEDLKALLHDADEAILLALLENPHFDQAHAETLLDRLDLSSNVLGAVAQQPKWLALESVRLRLAKHPRTPRRTALAVLRQLFVFDLVRLTLTLSAPPEIRRAAEEAILARVPQLPVGEKLTLARRGPARVAGAIVAEGHPQALKLALDNSSLTESQILKILAKPGIAERVVVAIAAHSKWSCQYNVRVALVRHARTPDSFVRSVLADITLRDLQDLSEMQELPPDRRDLLAGEMARRTTRQ